MVHPKVADSLIQLALDQMDNSVEEIIKIYEEALNEIKGIAHVSEGRAAAFYGMLAENALKKAKELNTQSVDTLTHI